jgi:hypothetical protein
MTFMRQSKEILLLTLYESRINRNIRKNMEQLRALQTERKAQHVQALEEAQLLSELAADNGETFDPAQHGFAFSTVEINFRIQRKRQLQQARALPQSIETARRAA